MGVMGLTPFLLKQCPSVIKTLPDRFESLRGKTVAIDGTLVTQRLHYAPAIHPYRHVLGWYRLISELKAAGVNTICVFDGRERNKAKLSEIAKRKETRRILGLQGSLEIERSKRLQKLADIFMSYDRFSREDWETAQRTLRTIVAKEKGIRELSSSPTKLQSISKKTDGLVDKFDSYDVPGVSVGGYFNVNKSKDAIADESLENNIDSVSEKLISSLYESGYVFTSPVYETKELDPEWQSDQNISTIITRLYLSFTGTKSSLLAPKLLAISTPSVIIEPDEILDIGEEELPDVTVTKVQHLLTLEESRIWEKMANTTSLSDDKTLLNLSRLAQQSQHISDSYSRRSTGPTNATYDDSRTILSAMGIACLDCSGPYEAEALAASLVIHGHANFVASEDTDVLVYEAPLIRNITKRRDPLVIISGVNVRNALQLDRESYIDFALLLGTDFSQRIRKIGPSKALKLIREYGSIEGIIENEKQYDLPAPQSAYLKQVDLGREIFRTIPSLTNQIYSQHPYETDSKLVAELMTSYGLSRWLDSADLGWELETSRLGGFFNDNPLI